MNVGYPLEDRPHRKEEESAAQDQPPAGPEALGNDDQNDGSRSGGKPLAYAEGANVKNPYEHTINGAIQEDGCAEGSRGPNDLPNLRIQHESLSRPSLGLADICMGDWLF